MEVDCPRCKNRWDWNGSGWYAQCPKCKKQIQVKDNDGIYNDRPRD